MFYAYHPDDSAEIAAMYQLDPKKLARPMEYMFHGLGTLAQFRLALEALLKRRYQREIAKSQVHHPDPDADIYIKLANDHGLEMQKTRAPLWKIISEMPTIDDLPYAPRERRRALTIVINAVELLVRHELEFAESDEEAIAHSTSFMLAADEHSAPSLLRPRKRTVYWTPIPGICAALGLSRIALTRMSQELFGRSAHEIVDDVVAENVQKKMKAILHPQLRAILEREHGSGWHAKTRGMEARDVWHKLKKERAEPEYSRVAYAQDLGFPNYQRLNRACLTVYRKSPHQLELLLIEEFLSECANILEYGSAAFKNASAPSENPQSQLQSQTPVQSFAPTAHGSPDVFTAASQDIAPQHVQKNTAGNVA